MQYVIEHFRFWYRKVYFTEFSTSNIVSFKCMPIIIYPILYND